MFAVFVPPNYFHISQPWGFYDHATLLLTTKPKTPRYQSEGRPKQIPTAVLSGKTRSVLVIGGMLIKEFHISYSLLLI